MLDYFLQKGFVKMNEDGSVERTEKCPDKLQMWDIDGQIRFFWRLFIDEKSVLLKDLNEPDTYEQYKNQ